MTPDTTTHGATAGITTAPRYAVAAEDIADAYVYLLGRVLVIRQERNDLREEGVTYNAVKYNPLGSADFVNPNFDVAYLEAWIATDDRTAVLLEVPEITGRYYTAQLLDEWGEVIANINERTFPSHPFGRFALVKPGSTATVPEDAVRIELHSSKAKLLGRVELKDDPEGAVRLQRQFRVTPLGDPTIAPPPVIPTFGNKELVSGAIFGDADTILASALDVSPVAAEMQQRVRAVAAFARSSREVRAAIDEQLRDVVVPEFQEYATTKSTSYRDHWLVGNAGGTYGRDYRLRMTANYVGIWANVPDEVVYFMATRDAEEKPLNGSNAYVLHFPADRLPDAVANAYWSVILVSVPDYRVVPNPLNRFNFNDHSPLQREADGSLKLVVGPKPAAGVPESNWLPSAAGKPFSLTFRAYVPKPEVMRGEWTPPPVTAVKS